MREEPRAEGDKERMFLNPLDSHVDYLARFQMTYATPPIVAVGLVT
jgi:hypothetical protein